MEINTCKMYPFSKFRGLMPEKWALFLISRIRVLNWNKKPFLAKMGTSMYTLWVGGASSLHLNDVATSFRRDSDVVIASWAQWVLQVGSRSSVDVCICHEHSDGMGAATKSLTDVKLAPYSPASYSRIWDWRIWCQLHVSKLPTLLHCWYTCIAEKVHYYIIISCLQMYPHLVNILEIISKRNQDYKG